MWIWDPGLDRFDMDIKARRVDYEKLMGDRIGEPFHNIRAHVQAAREMQMKRLPGNGLSNPVRNAEMRVGQVHQFCGVGRKADV